MDSRQKEILDALRVFIPEGQITELRAFNGRDDKAIEGTLYRDLEAMAARAIHLEDRTDASGIYFVLNPANANELRPDQKSRKGSLNAKKIARRYWLPIDADPVRFNEFGEVLEGDAAKVSSTDAEHLAAWEVIRNCRELLDSMQFVGGIVGDSGNGWHLCYPIDLPNDQQSYDLISEFLERLEFRCGSNLAHVDQKPKDAPRVWKLYGTLARKGEPTEQRPHRRSWVEARQPPTQEQRETNNVALKRLLDIWRDQDGPAVRQELRGQGQPKQKPLPGIDLVERARRFIAEKKIAVQGSGTGEGSDACYHVACALVWGFALSDQDALAAISDWNSACLPPWPTDQLLHKFDSARKATNHAEPYGHLRDAPWEPQNAKKGQAASASGQASSRDSKADNTSESWRVIFNDDVILEGSPADVLAGSVEESVSRVRVFEMRTMGSLRRKVFPEPRWIVPGVMSEGLNILAGAPKQGKSMLALNLALTVAGGGKALGNVKVDPFDVIYLSLEDKQRRVKARAAKMLTAIEADLAACIDERLTVATEWPNQHEGGLRLLDIWTQRVASPGLIIIDVLGQFAPAKQQTSSAYAQDYAYVSQIKQFADRHGLTVLLIHHTRKRSTVVEAEDYLQEVSGTLGITGAADGILVLLRSRQDNQASLHITGRDVVEQELVLEFDVNALTWKSVGTAAEHIEGRVRQGIVKYLRSLNGESAFATDIASAIGEKDDSVRRALGRLRAEKIIRKVGNAWSFPGEAGSGDELGI